MHGLVGEANCGLHGASGSNLSKKPLTTPAVLKGTVSIEYKDTHVRSIC